MTSTLAPNILERIKRIEVTPTIPAILLPLMELLKAPSDSVEIEEVVRLVSYDNAISAQCLRMANSPLFGLAVVRRFHVLTARTGKTCSLTWSAVNGLRM